MCFCPDSMSQHVFMSWCCPTLPNKLKAQRTNIQNTLLAQLQEHKNMKEKLAVLQMARELVGLLSLSAHSLLAPGKRPSSEPTLYLEPSLQQQP